MTMGAERDMERKLREEFAGVAGKDSKAALHMEDRAGWQDAEAQAGLEEGAAERVGVGGTGEDSSGGFLRGEAVVGGEDEGGGGRSANDQEAGGEVVESMSATHDDGSTSVAIAQVFTALGGEREVEKSRDGAEEGEGGSGGQGGEERGGEVGGREGKEGDGQGQARKLNTNTVDTSGVRAAVDGAANGDVILWDKGTNLAQTWSINGMHVDKAITLECTDVVALCTIDAQANNGDRRRVLRDNHGTYSSSNYIGIKFRGGFTVRERRRKIT